MTKFGMSVSVGVLIVVVAVGLLVFGRTAPTPSPMIPAPETPIVNPEPVKTPTAVEFNKAFSMDIGDKVVFPDLATFLQLKEINDSRCKPGVQCFWQGELSAVFTLSFASSSTPPTEVRLGTVNNKSISLGYYKFTLESATTTSASITVSNTKKGN